jgi:hypothetical protein
MLTPLIIHDKLYNSEIDFAKISFRKEDLIASVKMRNVADHTDVTIPLVSKYST